MVSAGFCSFVPANAALRDFHVSSGFSNQLRDCVALISTVDSYARKPSAYFMPQGPLCQTILPIARPSIGADAVVLCYANDNMFNTDYIRAKYPDIS